jgi:hypothetical protein
MLTQELVTTQEELMIVAAGVGAAGQALKAVEVKLALETEGTSKGGGR